MHRVILVCLGIGAVTGATPAEAEGPYLGIEGGVYAQQQIGYNFVGLSNFFSTKYAKGYDVAGRVGYDFEGIRVEAEFGYKRAPADQFGFSLNGTPLAVQRGAAVSGSLNTASAMVNGYWDITQKRFSPYVGGGIGVARVASNKVGYAGFGASGIFLDKSAVGFEYNLMAGVKARVTKRFSLNMGYKYADVDNFRLHVFNTKATSSERSSAVLFGVSFSFGHSIRDTPPPPRPPIPTAPSPELPSHPVPIQTTFSVSFAESSSVLTPDMDPIFAQILPAYRTSGHATVMLLNQQAGSGLAKFDETLAGSRAGAVKAALINQGVPPQNIITQTFDASHAGPSPLDVPPTSFVIISFGPGSGQ